MFASHWRLNSPRRRSVFGTKCSGSRPDCSEKQLTGRVSSLQKSSGEFETENQRLVEEHFGLVQDLEHIQKHVNFCHEDDGEEFQPRTKFKDEIIPGAEGDFEPQTIVTPIALGHGEHEYKASQVDSRAKESDVIKFKSWPSVPGFKQWWRDLTELVASSSRSPNLAYFWITSVDRIDSYDEMKLHEAHATLDSKLLAGLSNILQGEIRKKIHVINKEIVTEGCMMQGRQLACLIRDHFKMSTTQG